MAPPEGSSFSLVWLCEKYGYRLCKTTRIIMAKDFISQKNLQIIELNKYKKSCTNCKAEHVKVILKKNPSRSLGQPFILLFNKQTNKIIIKLIIQMNRK